MRRDKRKPEQMRPVKITTGVNPYAEGSAEVCFGNTKVLVTASVEQERPKWMDEGQGGWITAEYGMLPRSTHTRNRREASSGKQGGRTLEIQRLIGRALRQAVSLKALEGLTIKLDCDVLCADGGTRTAAISGGWVALKQALEWCKEKELLGKDAEIKKISAVSVGSVDGEYLLDLCYEEDSAAEFDLNLVFNQEGNIIEIQGTAEERALSPEEIQKLLELGYSGIKRIMDVQEQALSS